MSIELQKEQKHGGETAPEAPRARPAPLLTRFRSALQEVNWKITLLTALAMAIGWCMFFLSTPLMQILAGIVPVTAGLFLGRRVKTQPLLHGLILGFGGFLMGLVIIATYASLANAGVIPPVQMPDTTGQLMTVSMEQLLLYFVSFSALALGMFPAFGVVMAARAAERNRDVQQRFEERGGRLERPSVVRTLEDLRGLSLPQLGSYVNNLFQKHKFAFDDYRFIDKDKHLDLEMSYQGEKYLLRLSVADKVRSGTVESLVQDMRRRNIPKGLVITSTEFSPELHKTSRSRKHVVLIDGPTLFEIAEGH